LGAQLATLSIMIGGDEVAFNKALPLLSMLGSKVLLMGPSGAGNNMKAVNQLLTAIHTVACGEAMLLAKARGLNLDMVYDILMVSFGGSNCIKRNWPMASKNIKGEALLRNIVKDVGVINSLSESSKISLPLGNVAGKILKDATENGFGLSDLSAIYEYLQQQNR